MDILLVLGNGGDSDGDAARLIPLDERFATTGDDADGTTLANEVTVAEGALSMSNKYDSGRPTSILTIRLTAAMINIVFQVKLGTA